MKRFLIVFMMGLGVCLTVCGSSSDKNEIENELGVDASSGKVFIDSDTHGGFHGDGMTYTVIEFSDDALLEQLQENETWNEFPLNETVEILVYGKNDMIDGTAISNGPYVTDSNGTALIPQIQNGYYILIDRHTEKEKDMLERNSFNFTLGIYDVDTKLLYFCRFDT